MTAPAYTEFEWQAEGAGNGAAGEKLTRVVVELVKNLDSVPSICDLGCGKGHISGRLAALGYHVTGVDGSMSGIQIARRAYPGVEFVHALIDRDLNLGQFDLVISSDVIEHLYRPSDLLEAAVSQLKPNGQLLFGHALSWLSQKSRARRNGQDGRTFFCPARRWSHQVLQRQHPLKIDAHSRIRRSELHVLRPRAVALEEHDLSRTQALNAGPDYTADTDVQRSAKHRTLAGGVELGEGHRRRR